LIVVAMAIAALVLVRYRPALDEAHTLRADFDRLTARIHAAGLGIDRSAIDEVGHDLDAARGRLDDLGNLLAGDPLIGVARWFPPTHAQVTGADSIVAAARELLDAADDGRAIGARFIEIKDARTAGSSPGSALPDLVELMATSHERAHAAVAAFTRAETILRTVPDDLAPPLEDARDAMLTAVERYGPILESYVTASSRLPALLGWGGPRRYLVLTQDPAELRPTGGFIGSYGIVAFDRGRMTERVFRDVFLLDVPWDFPFIKPPTELANYLLGPKQPWQLADANWSPEFSISAEDALRLYTNESGDDRIDGVLGITTFTIDELLKVTGPIAVPEYGATIASGETTLKTLQLTRAAKPGQNRKAFLSTFADRLFEDLFALPGTKWQDILNEADDFRTQRLLLAWFKNDDDEAFAAAAGFDGAVRKDGGDFLYPVDSNVAPASKLNAITTRSLSLDVAIDRLGNVTNTLDVNWQNGIDTPAGTPYRKVPTLEGLRVLGMYFRLLAPSGSRVESVSGGSLVNLTAPASVTVQAGRTMIGTYLMVPPGATALRYVWSSAGVAEADERGWTYRLTVQKQPGLLPGPLTVTIRAPEGFTIASVSDGVRVSGDAARLTTSFAQDVGITVEYRKYSPATP
jgi:hypothetical protein